MKMKSLILALLVSPAFVIGQVTMSSTEDFTIGTILRFKACDTNGIAVGLTGPKQTWDYSQLQGSGADITETMVAPGTTPDGKQFPKANLVEKYSDGKYVYVDKEGLYSYMVGFSGNGMLIEYAKPVAFAKRPVSFGGTNSFPFTDKLSGNGANLAGTGMSTIAADGYGTLLLPDKKKYTNVLRVKITQKQKDTSPQGGAVNLTTTVTYVWFDEKHKSALLKINVISSPNYNGKTVEYLLSEEDK